MPGPELTKQTVSINFAQGLETKLDPWQLPVGKFTQLTNAVFSAPGGGGGQRLNKRNGFGSLTELPNDSYNYLTTLGGGLVAVGDTFAGLSEATNQWTTHGTYQQLGLSVLPVVRNSQDVVQVDAAVSGGLTCLCWVQQTGSATTGLISTEYPWSVVDQATGQTIIVPSNIPVIAGGTISGSSRVFVVGSYFVIVSPVTVSGTVYLQYFSVSISNPTAISAAYKVHNEAYTPITNNPGWDGVVGSGTLVIAYNYLNSGSGLQGVHVTSLTEYQIAANATSSVSYAFNNEAYISAVMSMCCDTTQSPSPTLFYISFFNNTTDSCYTCAVTLGFGIISPEFAPQLLSFGVPTTNLASGAQNGSCTVFAEVATTYGYDETIPTNYVTAVTVSKAGSVGTPYIAIRSCGLGSKAFFIDGTIYFLAAFQSPFQPTYFLMNGTTTTAASPQIVAKLAYENGGGYLTIGLPSASVPSSGGSVCLPYLYKDLAQALNTENNTQQTTTGGIYSQTGVNMATFVFEEQAAAVEAAGALHATGGFLWEYDGQQLVEHNFFLWPDQIECDYGADSTAHPTGTASNGSKTITLSTADGSVGMSIADSTNPTYIPAGTTIVSVSGTTVVMSAATTHAISGDTLTIQGNIAAVPTGGTEGEVNYYYQALYAWTDAAGMVHRSAPSIPVSVTTSGTGTTGATAVYVPTLRLTMKTGVRIELYRWSTYQQTYTEITSPAAPLLNDTTIDYVMFEDVYPDSEVIGNQLIYTTGGVVEDVNAPASGVITQFDTRLWVLDAEDPNLWWYSKTLVEGVPVEMSDLLTYYVQPSVSAQGPTGPTKAAAPMDDKLVMFKQTAIYYINGTGPDSTGANSQYSQPIFVVGPIGCDDPDSIVMTPTGLMFQASDGSGLWLLNRSSLQVEYIGAAVEAYNAQAVTSSACPPGTTQVRSTLADGQQLMMDYYYGQWASFQGAPAVSSCIYQGLHTILTPSGDVLQETPGAYSDASTPVRMGFTTGWISLAGLQGYERLYEMALLANYQSPHGLLCSIAYDFGPISESKVIRPSNRTQTYGQTTPYGNQSQYGGPGTLEEWKISVRRQTCTSFQITIQEIADSYGQTAGAGFTMSGLALTVGIKKGRRPIGAAQSR